MKIGTFNHRVCEKCGRDDTEDLRGQWSACCNAQLIHKQPVAIKLSARFGPVLDAAEAIKESSWWQISPVLAAKLDRLVAALEEFRKGKP